MPVHHTPLIATIAASLVLAFVFGLAAHRARVSPLVGYLLAGIAIGPFTPGFVADQVQANELAEIGVVLLLFAVGLHFSLKDLMAVRAIALPGALIGIAVGTALGMALAASFGWPLAAGLVFGLALSVASTVVLMRALQERRLMDTERGHLAVGWVIVEDLAMVVALVLLPALGPALAAGDGMRPMDLGITVALTLAKVSVFVAIMLVAGRRIIPWVMHYAAHTGSRELFRLAVYAVALGVAFAAAQLFGVSFALGAFFAGMVMGESKLSQRATEEALPLRDAFAVLFFVSVGMLFDPHVLLASPLEVLAVVGIIMVGKPLVAFLFVRACGHPNGTALTIAASLAQVGEFSFILTGLGVATGMLPAAGRDLVLAGAILSILLNPLLFGAVERGRVRLLRPAAERLPRPAAERLPRPAAERLPRPAAERRGHSRQVQPRQPDTVRMPGSAPVPRVAEPAVDRPAVAGAGPPDDPAVAETQTSAADPGLAEAAASAAGRAPGGPDRLVPIARPAATRPPPGPGAAPAEPPATSDADAAAVTHSLLEGHEVIVGYGRVGSILGAGLAAAGRPMLVFEEGEDGIEAARRDGAEVVAGNAADPEVLAAANLGAARRLFVTIAEPFEAGQVVEQARAANPGLEILARAHSEAAVEHLNRLGATLTVMGEREIAQRMLESALPPREPDRPSPNQPHA